MKRKPQIADGELRTTNHESHIAASRVSWPNSAIGLPFILPPRSARVPRRSAPATRCSPHGFTLLEIILVLVLIGIAAALLMPSVSAAFATYHLERAAEDLQYHLARTRLQAMELGVPYAFTYRTESDQFITWSCEPLDLTGALSGTSSGPTAAASAVASGDSYDRRYFELNDKPDNREFRFLPASLDEALASLGLGYEARTLTTASTSAESVGASSLLSQRKLSLVAPSTRSIAALQIPGLQLGDVIEPIVFEPDGAADRDAIIRVADRSNRYVELTVHGLTGAITTSGALSGKSLVTTAEAQARTSFVAPSRSRELRQTMRGTQ